MLQAPQARREVQFQWQRKPAPKPITIAARERDLAVDAAGKTSHQSPVFEPLKKSSKKKPPCPSAGLTFVRTTIYRRRKIVTAVKSS
jgi:hypothetical protein